MIRSGQYDGVVTIGGRPGRLGCGARTVHDGCVTEDPVAITAMLAAITVPIARGAAPRRDAGCPGAGSWRPRPVTAP